MVGSPDIRVATPGESGRDHIIISPFQFYVNGEDHLRITSANSLTGVVLEITGRFFDQDTQQITPILERQQPNTDRSIKQTLVRLGKGYVLNLAVRVITGAPLVGQTFVILELVRGFTGATQFLGVMSQGYVTARQGLAWPGSPIQSSLDGPGVARSITGALPAAGAEVSESVPTGARWQLRAFTVGLTCSAAVANRQPTLRLNSGGGLVGNCLVTTPETASQNGLFTWGPGLPLATIAAWPIIQGCSPIDFLLLAGGSIATLTSGIQAADQYQTPVYLVTEWLEVAA